jgi:2-polyprenyl-6-methoxyphenol hydroxylase-like FAD-dependent oxidoreductase
MKTGQVAIIGGGFGGLVAAIALADRGWGVRLYERRAAVDSEGYGIAVQRNMAHIFQSFGVLDAVLAGGARLDRRDSVDRHGTVLMSRPTERSPYRVDRRHIVTILAERAQAAGAELCFGKTVIQATNDGELVTEDAQQSSADLIVIANGVNSTLRDETGLLAQRRLERDGAVRVAIPRLAEEIEAADSGGTPLIEAWADNRRVLYCPVDRHRFYVLLGSLEIDHAARTAPIDPDIWSHSFPTLRGFFERVAAEADWDEARWAQYQTITLKRWSTGKIAVLGDAAHGMPPYLAQGAGHAMMNALGLAVALEKAPDISSGLEAWERRERPLTDHTQRWTRIYGNTLFLPGPLKQLAIRAEQHVPWLAKQYARAANHMPTGCTAA